MQTIFSNRKLFLSVAGTFVGLFCIGMSFSAKAVADLFQEPVDSFYLFSPKTILQSLSQGNSDVFFPQPDTFEPISTEPTMVVKWSQNDYVNIGDALHSQLWNEPLEDWKLHSMLFYADCEHIDQGPQQARFEFYKITRAFYPRLGHEETIAIAPATNSIWLKNEGLNSRAVYKHSIDLMQLQISVDDAFQIAETQGGREARLGVKSNCSVSAILAPDGAAKNWLINYSNKDNPRIFDIAIDEYSGEYEVKR
jgi:hypothetical protein